MAKMKVTYENLTPLLKKVNKRRMIATAAGWIITLVIAVPLFFGSLFSGIKSGGEFVGVVIASGYLGFVIGSIVAGIVHIETIYGKIKALLFIPIAGWIIWIFIVYFAAVFYGMVVMIANVIRFVLKKPLFFAFEVDEFIRKEAEQNLDAAVTEAAYNSVMGQQNVQNNNSAESLAKLKEMLDNGLITENEYDVKKAEILSRM